MNAHTRTLTPGFSGSKTIATLTLKAKVGSGSTQISFNGDSKILKNSDSQNVMTGSPAGIFNFGLVPTSTLTPFMATNKPTPTTQTNTPTFSPIKNPATLNPASIPIVTQSPKFYDNINVPILYGVIAVSLALAISGILYLILRRKIS
jgi:hypothetical protein